MAESMNDYLEELEKSYSLMGDGAHNTDELLSWQKAKELLVSKEPVTVTVTEVKRGGVIVDFESIKGFIPISRISLERIDDLKPYLFSELTVQVIEVDMDEDKLVFSAKELLKKQAEEEHMKEVRKVVPGMVLVGTVESLKDYGAFIKLDGNLSGLVHISQICEKRIKHPYEVLEVGQKVNVKVLDVKDGKISLSTKDFIEDGEDGEGEYADFSLSESKPLGTSMASLLKGIKLD